MVDEAHATGAIGPGGRGSVAAAGPQRRGRRRRRHARQGARLLRRLRLRRRARRSTSWSTPPAPSSSRPRRRPRSVAAALAALELLESQPHRVERLQANAAALRAALAAEGLDAGRLADPDRADRGRRRRATMDALRAAPRARRLRPGDPPADRPRGLLAPALHGDGDPSRRRAGAGREAGRQRPPGSSASRADARSRALSEAA